MNIFLVFTTIPTQKAARQLVGQLLKKRLAACAHIAPVGESHYWWKGKLEKAKEVTVTLKSSKKALPSLIKSLKEHHPYEIPEILAIRTDTGYPPYINWVKQETDQ